MLANSLALTIGSPSPGQGGSGGTPPVPPDGFMFVVDEDGNYILDGDGNYIVVLYAPPVGFAFVTQDGEIVTQDGDPIYVPQE